MSHDDDLLTLNGKRYWKQSRWSRDKNITVRTAARHRQLGLAWLDWGGEIYIPEVEGDAYIVARMRRRNPPRRRKTAIATQAENHAV
jgi:hypothetical protein